MKNKLILLLGGNVGDKLFYLKKTMALLSEHIGTVIKTSSVYKTAAWGFNSEDFYNIAVLMATKHSPLECLNITQSIEKTIGRKEKSQAGSYCSRCIDIDLMFYNELIFRNEHLCIPHERMLERKFVLIALNEIIKEYVHPIEKKPIYELLRVCKDQSKVIKTNEYL